MLQEVDVYKMLVNGEQWGKWKGYHLPISEEYVTVWTPIGTPMHWKPGKWVRDKHSLTYFWTKTSYSFLGKYFAVAAVRASFCDLI